MKRIIFLAVSVFLVIPVYAWAQASDLRIVTSPLPINLSAKPGTSVTTQIRVKNDGSQPERLKMTLMKFSAYGENGAPRIMDGEPGDQFLTWVEFPQPTFDIMPGEWKSVPMKITLPDSAAFGYYYAVVFSRDSSAPVPEPGQTAISGGTAVLVLLDADVPGAKREAQVLSFSTGRTVYEFLPVDFNVLVRNSGNVHLAPRGNVFVGRVGSDDYDILEVNAEKGNILPDSNREFGAIWADGFPAYRDRVEDGSVVRDQKGDIVRELSWELGNIAKFRIGKYQARLVLVYDDGQRDVPLEGAVEFWVIPWRILLVVTVLIVLIGFGVRSILGSVWKKVSGVKKR
ncbi:MAG: hypothetical protein HGA38_05625 [Candidatus Moranbacteria bacterium]|nr:hypothetical protein [Candidatus Moranbacteria bacterium]